MEVSLMIAKNNDIKKVHFKRVGRRKQHEVTLFELVELPFDIATHSNSSKQSRAEELLTHYWVQAKNYLQQKGFEDTDGLFHVSNGKVIMWDQKMGKPLEAMPL